MLRKTYEKVNELFEQADGYLPTRKLLENKITTIQIRNLINENKIEKISHGYYWNLMSGRRKPEHHKMLEACMTNSRAVICALSACYYHGLLEEEPEKLYIATQRTDRGGMKLPFPVSRHYFSVATFTEDLHEVGVGQWKLRIFGMDRSVCDCIRLEKEIGQKNLQLVLGNYRKNEEKNTEFLLSYADRMRFGRIARQYLEKYNVSI